MIKKCPFCGGEAKQVALRYPTDMQFADDIQKFYVTCTRCNATGKPIYLKNAQYRGAYLEEVHKAEKEALDAWNTRTEEPKEDQILRDAMTWLEQVGKGEL